MGGYIMVHVMTLFQTPFEQIKNGTKKIEYRLNDEKRSKISVGDRIIFTNIETDEQIEVKVVELYKAHTFEELRKVLMRQGKIDYNEFSPADMLKYYSREKEYQYGVLGIAISMIKRDSYLIDTYLERFKESPYATVAEYVIRRQIDFVQNNYPECHIDCGDETIKCTKDAIQKLKHTYTGYIIIILAYYVKFINKEMNEDEWKEALTNYSKYKESDVKKLLECTCSLSYRLPRYKRRKLKDFLE